MADQCSAPGFLFLFVVQIVDPERGPASKEGEATCNATRGSQDFESILHVSFDTGAGCVVCVCYVVVALREFTMR